MGFTKSTQRVRRSSFSSFLRWVRTIVARMDDYAVQGAAGENNKEDSGPSAVSGIMQMQKKQDSELEMKRALFGH